MIRYLRLIALVTVIQALAMQARGQSDPEPTPVTPVTVELKSIPAAPPPIAAPASQPVVEKMVDDSKARIAKLEADLAEARAEARKARNEVKDSHDRYAAERDSLASQVATLTRERNSAFDSRDYGRVEIAAAKAKLESYSTAIREGAPVDSADLVETLRRSESKVDMTVRAFAVIEQENERLLGRVREAEAKASSAEDRSRGDSSEVARLRGELARAEQARSAAITSREAALRELAAAQIRNDNLARELGRARPDMALVYDATPRAAPSFAPEPEVAGTPATAAEESEVHTVADGENLSIISHRYYKTPNRWLEIYNANKDVMKNENHVVPGMKLRIP